MTRRLLPLLVMVAIGLGTAFGLLAGAGPSGASTATYGSGAKSTHQSAGTKPTATPGATHLYNTRPKVTPTATACEQVAQKIGYKSPKTSGSPQNSKVLNCQTGTQAVSSYGNQYVTYKAPTPTYVSAGQALFEQHCSSCHMPTAGGGVSAPSLRGVGPATVDFWVTTGRMPAATSAQIQADVKPPLLGKKTADEIAAWINSLTPSAPFIPHVTTKKANLADGAELFTLNCAACHTITGAGDALAYGTYAPALRRVDATQVAEAIRTGPGNMPRFTGSLNDRQLRDLVAYVTEKIEHPTNIGGFGLGGVGPVTEGFVALLIGVGGLLLVCFWIGDRA